MTAHVRIKICGITNADDARQGALLGADAIGLNFYEGSPRRVDPGQVRSILAVLPPFVEPVGLFVNVGAREACQRAAGIGGLRTLQLHGDNLDCTDPFPFRVIPAFAVKDASSLERIQRHLDACRSAGHLPPAILVDAYSAEKYGGTGHIAPWNLLAGFRPPVPLILAGGLTPDNVAEAIRIVRPYGVDVASGVEREPGIKDLEKLRRFIDIVRTG